MHNVTKTLSITIKWVCAGKGWGGGICGDWGRSLCALNVQGGCKDPMWDAKGYGQGVGGNVSHLGK